jgi:hypothetical protein
MGTNPTSAVRRGINRKRTVPRIASVEGIKTPLKVPNFFVPIVSSAIGIIIYEPGRVY